MQQLLTHIDIQAPASLGELRGLERWTLPGLFSSEHRVRIVPLPLGGVRFHHDERVQGILVSLLTGRGRLRSRSGFDARNAALKQRAERACAASLAATS